MEQKTLLSPAHRHFVVLPMVAVLLLIPLLWVRHADTSASGSRLPQVEGLRPGKSIQYAEGISIAAGGETAAWWTHSGTTIDLQKGTILFAAQGFGSVHVGAWTFHCLSGGMFLSLTKELTVAPLTCPVLASDGKGHEQLLPPHTQWTPRPFVDLQQDVDGWWKARAVEAVPQLFVNAQMAYLQPLFASGAGLPAPVEKQPVPPYGTAQVLGFARTLSLVGDDPDLQKFLADPAIAAVFSGATMRTTALPAMLRESGRTATALVLLPFLLQDARQELLLQLHPSFRTAAWTLPAAPLTREELLLRFFWLPHFDVERDAVDPSVVQRWEEAGRALLAKEPDVPATLTPFLADMTPFLSRLAELGYPERVVRYADAIGRLAEPYAEYLPQASQRALKSIHKLSRSLALAPGDVSSLVGSLLPVATPPHQATTQSSSHFSSATFVGDAEAVGRQMLLKAGVLLTVQSHLTGHADGLVDVESVAVGDALYDFTFDVVHGVVSHLVAGGEEMPNSLPLSQFVQWALSQ